MSGTLHTLKVPVQCSHVAKNDIDCFACTSFLRTLKVLAAHCKIEVTVHFVQTTTSEMIHHHGVSLSKQQTADLLLCHDTQQDLIMLISS